jgi:hypothetical protein
MFFFKATLLAPYYATELQFAVPIVPPHVLNVVSQSESLKR